jgi:hypothetical protein
MSIRVLFDGQIRVDYGQMYVQSDPARFASELERAFAGQRNGLCGSGTPGALFLITGLNMGDVGLTIEAHDTAPSGGEDQWEEIVEASFTPLTDQVSLVPWGAAAVSALDLDRVDHRVRYCADGMEQARAADLRMEGEPELDRYLLQFWPESPGPDRIVKQTTEIAAYWHSFARNLPDPPPPPTPQEQAEADRLARLAEEKARQQAQEVFETRRWDGEMPTERLRRVGGNVIGLARLDRRLLDLLGQASADKQRELARWAARQAYEQAGLADLDWVRPALEALDRGQPLPPPFNDTTALWDAVFTREEVPRTRVTRPAGGERNISRQAAAVPAVRAAAETDPLRAAINALYAAAVSYGEDYRELLDEARRRVFQLRGRMP